MGQIKNQFYPGSWKSSVNVMTQCNQTSFLVCVYVAAQQMGAPPFSPLIPHPVAPEQVAVGVSVCLSLLILHFLCPLSHKLTSLIKVFNIHLSSVNSSHIKILCKAHFSCLSSLRTGKEFNMHNYFTVQIAVSCLPLLLGHQRPAALCLHTVL